MKILTKLNFLLSLWRQIIHITYIVLISYSGFLESINYKGINVHYNEEK